MNKSHSGFFCEIPRGLQWLCGQCHFRHECERYSIKIFTVHCIFASTCFEIWCNTCRIQMNPHIPGYTMDEQSQDTELSPWARQSGYTQACRLLRCRKWSTGKRSWNLTDQLSGNLNRDVTTPTPGLSRPQVKNPRWNGGAGTDSLESAGFKRVIKSPCAFASKPVNKGTMTQPRP